MTTATPSFSQGGAALAPFLAARDEVSPRAASRAGLESCHALSDLLDGGLRRLAEETPGTAVVAVGGYGRREQCRHSDIDVMLLVPRGGEEPAKRLLYPLWDARLKVGHSVRTVEQARRAGLESIETFTALLDARFVAGDQALFERFLETRRRLARAYRGRLERELAASREGLLAREPWQVQAPNLKTSRGGLRDVQAMHWLDAVESIATGEEPRALAPGLAAARERLLATRNGLHALAERPTDVYRDDLAPRIADWLDVDLYEWSRDLYLAMRETDATLAARLAPDRRTPRRRWVLWLRPDAGEERPPVEGERDLDRLFAVLRSVAPSQRGALPLEPLPREPWLDRLLPEWEVLRGRRHIAPFHIHPVDVHSMRTVAEAMYILEVDEDGTGSTRAAAALPDRREPLLAALMHDIGKGHEASHVEAGAVIAERFAARAGLSPDATQRLVRAVGLHLLLPAVATRRDIADERVIRDTAERVGDASTLHLLYLLSVADARATGTDIWSPWKAQLLRSLYLRVLDVLSAASPVEASAPAPRLRAAVEALATRFPREVVEDHVRRLEPSYLLSTPPEAIGDHIALVAQARASEHGTAVRRDRLGRIDRLTLATRDRPGLIQAVTGVLAGHNANVLGGVAYTRDDGVAIQVWHINDALGLQIDGRRWQRILDAAPRAIAGEFPIDERLAEVRRAYAGRANGGEHQAPIPTAVHIDNAASDRYSVIEVSTADRLGLLYAITSTLKAMAIDIHLAKVDTIGPEVVDAFYVRRENGRRIETPDEVARVESRIAEAIAALDGDGE